MIPELEIVVTKTADGLSNYVQISTPAAVPVNIVLIADQITVKDLRGPERKREAKKG